MKTTLRLLLFAALLAGCAARVAAQDYPFRDTSLPVEQRVDDLLQRLTLDEKLSMMEHQTPAVSRLGLAPYSWWNEALHGVARNGTAHVYPMPIAMAATFDPALVLRSFGYIAQEAQEKYRLSQRDGNYGDNAGLSFFAPNINIFRDPRWGRGMETFGEDPCLTALMGAAVVRGLQGGDRNHLNASACVKHFAAHSGPEGLRHEFNAEVEMRDLWCTYLPAFHYIVAQGNVEQVMCGYNRLNGSPCCTNDLLLTDLLRRRWHYDGLVVTDCWALNDCWERDSLIPRHETYPTAAQAAQAAFGSEVDLECGSGLSALRVAADSGYLAESTVDEHVRRILSLRLRLDLERKAAAAPARQPLPDAAEEMARRSLVLLKNSRVAKHYPPLAQRHGNAETLLPLRQYGKALRIAVVGPNSDDSLMALGNYNGTPEHCTTILEGFRTQACQVSYAHAACPLTGNGGDPGRRFWKKLSQSDVIVFVGGLSPALEGEELKVEQEGFCKGDRTQIELPAVQRDMIKKIRHRTGKPILLLLCTGGAVGLDEVVDDVDAIVVAWYGGEAMGSAVAQAVMEGSMRGHLPVTFYKNTRQLPPFDNYGMAGRTYRYMSEMPLFPFGFGLDCHGAKIDSVWYDGATHSVQGTVACGEAATASDSLLVQVYLQGYESGVDANKTLVAFRWVPADSRQSCFSIPLDAFWMTHFDTFIQESRPFKFGTPLTLLVGTSSAEEDLTPLRVIWE